MGYHVGHCTYSRDGNVISYDNDGFRTARTVQVACEKGFQMELRQW